MAEILTTEKIYCIEDAHTNSKSASNQHTNDLNINSVAAGRHTEGYQCYGFFKFAPSGVPDNAVIVSAVMGGRVYNDLLDKVMSLTARPCSAAWTDTEIGYRTMPTSAGVSDQVQLGEGGSRFESDITAIAQAWFGGGFAYENGLYITSSEAKSYKRIYSETASDSNKPYIRLTYYVPASTPTTDKTTVEIAEGAQISIATNRMSADYTHSLRPPHPWRDFSALSAPVADR